jgi:hypothetical protein
MADKVRKLDPDLETEAEFIGGDSDDPDRVVDSEALGARHRRRYGYSAEGAEENDEDIASKGRHPLKISGHKVDMPESRTISFHHGMTPHHITTVKKR